MATQIIKSTLPLKYIDFLRRNRDNYKEKINSYPYRSYTNKYKCIFIHIPKVAGTSLLEALGYCGQRDHCTYREYKKANFSKFKLYYKFCFVRNPYSRILSLYRYYKSGGNNSQDDFYFSREVSQKKLSINDFCRIILTDQLYLYNPMFWPQSMYVVDDNNVKQVDFIGRYEFIDEDYEKIRKKLKIKNKLKAINRTSFFSSGENMSVQTMNIINEIYAKDFKNFNYIIKSQA